MTPRITIATSVAGGYFDEEFKETTKLIGRTSIEDYRHIAMATIYKVNVLASRNFKYIVNHDRINGYTSVNLRLGHTMLLQILANRYQQA